MDSRIKWIFFDVGSTLIDEDMEHKRRFEAVWDELRDPDGLPLTWERIRDFIYDAGKNNYGVVPYTFRYFGFNTLRDERVRYSDIGEAAYPFAREALAIFKEHYNIGVIANQHLQLYQRMLEKGIGEYFEEKNVFGSADVGLSKPDPEFFRYAINAVGCAPEEALMVGDRIDNDIMPAKSVGMHTARIRTGFYREMPYASPEEIPDYDAADVLELAKVLTE